MINKILKNLCFFIYSYFIYQSYLFIMAIIALFVHDFNITFTLFKNFYNCFFSPFIFLYLAGIGLWNNFFTIRALIFIIGAVIVIAAYALLFIPWYKKQNMATAWSLALIGFCAGPGVIFLFLGTSRDTRISTYGIPTFFILNAIYFLLFMGNRWQKKYHPDNKLANTIRAILSWPCPRT